jgi:isopentenyl-diphosphate Delta-isomerase
MTQFFQKKQTFFSPLSTANMKEKEILLIKVDENDTPLGVIGKNEAHINNVLHRAFSVFIFNENGEWLLQKRAATKYHSPDLWSNSCCGHPQPGDDTRTAAEKRLSEEMGIHCKLFSAGKFLYRADLANGMKEHEFDHLFIGFTNQLPILNEEECSAFRYINFNSLEKEITSHPETFTAWFKMLYHRINNTQKNELP